MNIIHHILQAGLFVAILLILFSIIEFEFVDIESVTQYGPFSVMLGIGLMIVDMVGWIIYWLADKS